MERNEISWKREEIRLAFEDRIKGKKGAPEKRTAFLAAFERISHLNRLDEEVRYFSRDIAAKLHRESKALREKQWREGEGRKLAEKAGRNYDEHGYASGDYRVTTVLDFVPPWESVTAPYLDSGGEGLALIAITRTRKYAKSSKWYPSEARSAFLVGRNEAGTYFAHAVPADCISVAGAVSWIWGGREADLISRQGDIALIRGNAGPKLPAALPEGHIVNHDLGVIQHKTHPDLRIPGKGERIIIGRRATPRASAETRD